MKRLTTLIAFLVMLGGGGLIAQTSQATSASFSGGFINTTAGYQPIAGFEFLFSLKKKSIELGLGVNSNLFSYGAGYFVVEPHIKKLGFPVALGFGVVHAGVTSFLTEFQLGLSYAIKGELYTSLRAIVGVATPLNTGRNPGSKTGALAGLKFNVGWAF